MTGPGAVDRLSNPHLLEDRRLASNIAVMLRVGTAVASALLAVGAVLGYAHVQPAATILLAGGCALLVLLPVVRLMMMAGHFTRRAERRFIVVTIAVLSLVVAGAISGVVFR